MTDAGEQIALRIEALLLVVAAVSVFGLWTLSTSTVSQESLFAVYISIDLVCFAMISYIYRTVKLGNDPHRVPMLAGAVLLVLLMAVGLGA